MKLLLIWVVFQLFYASIVIIAAPPEKITQVVDHGGGELSGGGDGSNVFLGAGVEEKFISFMEKNGKEYPTREEYFHRLQVFAKNMIRVVENQALDPTAIHGITPFSDLTPKEFEKLYTGLPPMPVIREGNGVAEPLDTANLPESYDWRERGAVTHVKKQGICGACWAFTTTGAIEGSHFISTGELLDLSEQQLVDCDHTCDPSMRGACDNGCLGGLMTNAYKYIIQAGGIEKASSYPYTGSRGSCKFQPDKVAVRITNFTTIPLDEDQIAANLVLRGPLAVGVNAVFMQTYIGGVSCPLMCSKQRLNHGVLLVGYNSDGYSILRMKRLPYWIIKNSWGEEWGEEGYYKLCRGIGACGINTMVSAVSTF